MELIAVLIAVIIGYMLGVTPFMVYFLWKDKANQKETIKQEELIKEEKNQYEDMLTEWLYGKEEKKQPNQQEIYEEYITGEEKING